jgi:hypothetical protein
MLRASLLFVVLVPTFLSGASATASTKKIVTCGLQSAGWEFFQFNTDVAGSALAENTFKSAKDLKLRVVLKEGKLESFQPISKASALNAYYPEKEKRGYERRASVITHKGAKYNFKCVVRPDGVKEPYKF